MTGMVGFMFLALSSIFCLSIFLDSPRTVSTIKGSFYVVKVVWL
jgi:hypothetical protein